MEPQPRRWWDCPVDVEAFAWAAVTDVCAAAQELSRARGSAVEVGTTAPLVAASFAATEHLRVDGQPARGWAPMSGFFPAADGWVRLHANYPHHEAALRVALDLGADAGRADLERTLHRMPAQQVEDVVGAAGGIAVRARTRAQWARHPHAVATAQEPWWRVTDGRAGAALGPADVPLAGVRVLDLTRVIAGPTCTQTLACLGADVLRIDPPQRPELRDQYLSNGMGKRSAELDLADPGQRRTLESLLAAADVVVLGYRPGALARFGLDPDELARRHPGLIVGSLSAWGETGPWSQRPGFDSIVQATGGVAEACADATSSASGGSASGRSVSAGSAAGDAPASDWVPGALPVQALDHAAGYRLAAQIVRLLTRARGGVVRISLLGAARTLLSLPPPPEQQRPPGAGEEPMPVPTIELASPYGPLVVVPPPLLLDGRTVERPVQRYAGASPAWS